MVFYENSFFHVYNQGNNRRQIFFSRENYEFFKLKLAAYILPFASIIAYCLMPNHFHLLLFVHHVKVPKLFFKQYVENYYESYYKRTGSAKRVYKSQVNSWKSGDISLNEAFAILQRSYTRAINKERGWSGSLFRSRCKAKDEWQDKFVTIGDSNFFTGNIYVAKCMDYIHENPGQSGLVDRPEDWEFSSARDYYTQQENSICNLEIGRTLLFNK
jgi:putative transposase